MSIHTVARGASVLLAFRARNTRSFRDDIELSFIGTRLSEPEVVRHVEWHAGGGTVPVLPVAAIYGANASGKTNVLRAMSDMRHVVLSSFRAGDAEAGLPHSPFLLDRTSADEPTMFEIELVLEGVRHQYGFIYDHSRIHEEWAYRWPKGRSAMLFHRHGDRVELGSADRARSRTLRELLRPNALFLSTAAAVSHPTLEPLFAWFRRNLWFAEEPTRAARQVRTRDLLDDDATKEAVVELLRVADLGIVNARSLQPDRETMERIEKVVRLLNGQDETSDSPGLVLEIIELAHESESGEGVFFHPGDESLGTQVWLGLIGPVIDALREGAVLISDELDASLHPALVAQLVRLFQDPERNPRRAQLVANIHDVTLLGDGGSPRPLGRDQCWITEKLHDGSTRLFPIADYSPRKEESIGRRYLAGRYGGTPVLSDAEFDSAVARLLEESTPH